MLWLGHIALGYLTSMLFLFLFGTDFSTNQANLTTLVVIVSALIPDLDAIYFYFKFKSLRYQKKVSHRNWISHAPFLYLLIGLFFYFLFNGSVYSYIGLAFIFGSFSHFIADSIEYGVMWFYPFSGKKYSLKNAPPDSFLFYRKDKSSLRYYWDLLTKVYMKGATFYVEIIAVVLALVLLFA